MLINATWEYRETKSKCCRFVAWEERGDIVAGAVAGYSGGGCFQLEPFLGRIDENRLSMLWIDGEDRLTGEEADIEDFSKDAIDLSEKGIDVVFEWNEKSEWERSESLYLRTDKVSELIRSGDYLCLSQASVSWIKTVCQKVALLYLPA